MSIASLALMAQRQSWYPAGEISNTQIHSICRDNQGYVWIGTENGLNKFDGYAFTKYYNDINDTLSLANNYVRKLYLTSAGDILLTNTVGLQFLDPLHSRFTEVSVPSQMYFLDIVETPDASLWCLSSGSGLYRISPENRYVATPVLRVNDQLQSKTGLCLMKDHNSDLWIGSSDGIYVYESKVDAVTHFHKEELTESVVGMVELENGNIIILTSNIVFSWNRSEDTISKLYTLDSSKTFTHLFSGADGLPLASIRGEGLLYYDRNEHVVRQKDFGVVAENYANLDVSAYMFDDEGNEWLGCYMSGLLQLRHEERLFTYRSLNMLSTENGMSVSSIACDNRNNLWVGSNRVDLSCIDEHGNIISRSPGLYVRILYSAENGELWAGLFNRGLVQIDVRNGRIIRKVPFDDNSTVMSITGDVRGNIYYCPAGGGLRIYNPDTGDYTRLDSRSGNGQDQQLLTDWIFSMHVDSRGYLWLGHNSGLSCYNTNTGSFESTADVNNSIGHRSCTSIIEDNLGNIWVGTNNGLVCVSPDNMSTHIYTLVDGLSNMNVSCVQIDNNGMLWCSTQGGLNRVNPATGQITSYYSGYGLVDKTYNNRAGSRSPDGAKLFFASNAGITGFNPEAITINETPNSPVITRIILNGEDVTENTVSRGRKVTDAPVILSRSFRLGYQDNSFSLELNTFSYGASDAITYEYSFNPEKEGWVVSPTGTNFISFTKIPSGRYKLYLRARQNGTPSSETLYDLRILAPWYLSWIAFVVMALILMGVIVSVIMYLNKRSAQRLSEAKLDSFTNIAHEICSPMTMVISPLEELLERKDLDEQTRNSLASMNNNANRILNLINQLLDIRKYEEGRMRLLCTQTDLVQYTAGIYELFSHQASLHNISYIYEHADESIQVWVDRDRIERVIVNMLSNAFKYTPDGGSVSISIATGTDDKVDGPLHQYVEIVVKDTGIGLDVEDVDRVFDRFYRGQNSYTAMTLGTGVGLNYSRILVELHKGRIWAENRNDCRGSIFHVRIPLGNAHLKAEEMTSQPDMPMQPHTAIMHDVVVDQALQTRKNPVGKTILVIDDDQFILDYIKQGLSQNFKVVVCRNGKDGLRMAIANQPDLIITDVMMPEMDGIQLVKSLKTNSNVSHIPVIMLSARNRMEDRITGLEVGADAYLPKPFYMNELRTQALNLIDNRLRMKGKFSGQQEQKQLMELTETKSADEELMENLMKIVTEKLSDSEFTVEQLADDLAMSRTQLHRRIKDITGLSMGRFIQNLRMQRAVDLLMEDNMNVAQIAIAVGFSTSSHFSTTFKNHFGMTPSEYQKKMLQKEPSDGNINSTETE